MSVHECVCTSKLQDLPNLQASLPSSVEGTTQQFNTLTLVQLDIKLYVWGKAEFGVLHPMPGKCIPFAKAKGKSSWKSSLCNRKGVYGQARTPPVANLGPIKTPVSSTVNFLLQQSMSL